MTRLFTRRDVLIAGTATFSTALLYGCGSDNTVDSGPRPKAVVAWSKLLLEAVRTVKPGPPMLARSLAIVHTAMYDAWTAYDPVALSTRTRASLRRPAGEHSNANKTKAISIAAFLTCVDQFPAERARFETALLAQGFTLADATSTDVSKAEGVGARAAADVLAARRDDGANQSGSMTASGTPYADYSGYVAQNPAASISQPTSTGGTPHPDHWQPISFPDAQNVMKTPGFLVPFWGSVKPFALTAGNQFRPTPPKALGTPEFAAQAQRIVSVQQSLTDRQKVIAEYWADGPASELPPGHWMLFAQFVSERDKHDDDRDVRMFFALANALLDASIATWEAKRYYDYVRPITAVRFLMAGTTIQGFGNGGPAGGLAAIAGEAWRPFQPDTFPTPPFPEYTSGHSAFSASGATILRLFTGQDTFGASHTQKARTLRIDSNVPAQDVTLSWVTFSEAADEAGASRIYGGIHFDDGNTAGLDLGRKVGAQAFSRASSFWLGTAS